MSVIFWVSWLNGWLAVLAGWLAGKKKFKLVAVDFFCSLSEKSLDFSSDRIVSYLVDSVRKLPGNFLTESLPVLGQS